MFNAASILRAFGSSPPCLLLRVGSILLGSSSSLAEELWNLLLISFLRS
jgi:hypothetical protein